MKKLLLVIWVLYFSATCKQTGGKPDLVFINATSQDYSGGAAGSGQGTYYNFYFLKKAATVTCDSVWVNGIVLQATAVTKPNNDTVFIKARTYIRRAMGAHDRMPIMTPKTEAPPMPVKGAALISYTTGSGIKYVVVPTITKLKALAYP